MEYYFIIFVVRYSVFQFESFQQNLPVEIVKFLQLPNPY